MHAGATGVVNTNDGAADFNSQIHCGTNLLTEGFTDGTAEHSIIVGVHHHRATINSAVAGDNAIAIGVIGISGHFRQTPHLHKRAFIQEGIDALAGSCSAQRGALRLGTLTARVLGLGHFSPEVS